VAIHSLESLRDTWAAAWAPALAAWSKFTRLRPPMLCLTEHDAQREGLTGSFAMIRLHDQSVVVSLPEVVACGVEQFPLKCWRTKSAITCSLPRRSPITRV
jgi:hypothetical protein